MPALTIIIWLPLACGLLGALFSLRSERAPGVIALLGSLGAFGLAIGYIADYKAGAGLQHVTDKVWIAELGIHYKLAITGLNVFLVGSPPTCVVTRPRPSARASTTSTSCSPSRPCSARSSRRTSRYSSRSST